MATKQVPVPPLAPAAGLRQRDMDLGVAAMGGFSAQRLGWSDLMRALEARPLDKMRIAYTRIACGEGQSIDG